MVIYCIVIENTKIKNEITYSFVIMINNLFNKTLLNRLISIDSIFFDFRDEYILKPRALFPNFILLMIEGYSGFFDVNYNLIIGKR